MVEINVRIKSFHFEKAITSHLYSYCEHKLINQNKEVKILFFNLMDDAKQWQLSLITPKFE